MVIESVVQGTPIRPDALILLGGRLCLDFANTLDWRAGGRPYEALTGYEALILWSRHAGIMAEDQAARLIEAAIACPAEATAVFTRAIALREAIYRTLSAIVDGRSADAPDLATLNAELANAMPHLCVVATAEGFRWDWADDDALDRSLWPIARSAAELLVADELDRVRRCPGDTCGALFIDLTKNRSRRWCTMAVCGNRARVRRFYERQRSTER
jgi:predicted RNA-binding Zn ribbon-like protein